MSATQEYEMLDMIKKVDQVERINFIKGNNLHLLKVNKASESLLHIVAKHGDILLTQLLLEAGSEVNVQDSLGKTPLMTTIEYKPQGYLQVIEMLYKYNANIHIVDKSGKSAAHLVLSNYNRIYDQVHSFFLKIIHHESLNDSVETAKKLISLRYPLCQAVLLRNSKVIEQMIIQGCSVDSFRPDKSFSALSKAVQLMDIEIIKVLIEHGADVDLKDKRNLLPIFYYGTYKLGAVQQPDIIKILLNNSFLLKDLRQEDIICNLESAFKFGNKEVIQILLKHNRDVLTFRDKEFKTPLHYLSTNQHADVYQVLQGLVFDINVKDAADCTPLYIATKYSHGNNNMLKFLLENGADVNSVTLIPNLDTSLFSLCQNYSITKERYFEIVEMFLQYNLDIQYVGSSDEKTVFDIIIGNGMFYMAEPLLSHLAIIDESEMLIKACIRSKINSHEILKNYFNVCKVELAKMKNIIINSNTLTIYDIVVNRMTEEQILKKTRYNSDSIRNFENFLEECHRNNPYNSFIQKNISSTVFKLKLLQKAAPKMCKISKILNDPTHIVIIQILNYLDNKDLQNLIIVQT